MSFLQQALGKNYKWYYIFKYYFKYDFMLGNTIWHWMIGNLLTAFSFVFLWSFVVKNNDYAAYALVGAICTRLTGSWKSWYFAEIIRNGRIAKDLLMPTSFFKSNFVMSFTTPLLETFMIVTILSFLGFLIFGIKVTLPIVFISIPFVIMGSFINYCINCLIGYIAFWEENSGSFINMAYQITPFFSGGFIPLVALPFYEYLKYNPFAYLVHAPTQIYLGKYSTTEIIYTFAGGIVWCFLLWLLTRIVFKLGLKKNEAVGL